MENYNECLSILFHLINVLRRMLLRPHGLLSSTTEIVDVQCHLECPSDE